MEKHIIISKQEHENARKCLSITLRTKQDEGGIKDGVGFQPSSDKFVDNFILFELVADHLIHKKEICQSRIHKQNNTYFVRETWAGKCKVKAISLSNVIDIPAEMLAKMPFTIEEKECDTIEYFFHDHNNLDYRLTTLSLVCKALKFCKAMKQGCNYSK